MDVYLDDLADLDEMTLRAALNRYAQSGRSFFPTVPEILKAVADMQIATGAAVDGEAAWASFEKRVLSQYSFGITKQHDWPDPLTREIVREHLGLPVGGVHPLAMMESAIERDKYRKLFVRLYDERSGTAQAVERAELALDAPNVRRLPQQAGD